MPAGPKWRWDPWVSLDSVLRWIELRSCSFKFVYALLSFVDFKELLALVRPRWKLVKCAMIWEMGASKAV